MGIGVKVKDLMLVLNALDRESNNFTRLSVIKAHHHFICGLRELVKENEWTAEERSALGRHILGLDPIELHEFMVKLFVSASSKESKNGSL